MIEVNHLVKQYGAKRAVDDISFEVEKGEILGFLGPNGAGKSTTMNIITGYLSATEGTVTIDGHEILDDPTAAKRLIGYLPEFPPLYPDMTVSEYLSFVFDLKKLDLKKKAHIDDICELVKITDVYGRMIKNLSKGYKQRVGLAEALIGSPEVLILDEPTVGLDPKQIIEIRTLIKKLGNTHTVILSSHILPEVQAVCERVVVINHGLLVADGRPDELSQALSSEHKLSLRIEGPEKNVANALASVGGMEKVVQMGEREPGCYDYTVEAASGNDIRRSVFKAMAAGGWPILSMRSSELSLEDIFLQLTEDNTISKGGAGK